MSALRFQPFIFAALAGIVAVFGFAPTHFYLLPILSLGLLFGLWTRADSPRAAAGLGFAFGLGLFGVGIGWVYVALHEFGNMPMWLAFITTFLFVAFYALFPALVGYLQARLALPNALKLTLLLPMLWVAVELLRGYLFTGFPWLVLGYSQVPSSPLAGGYAPMFGVYGVSLAVAVSAGLIVLLAQQRWTRKGKQALMGVLALWLVAVALGVIEWTQPQGEPVKVSLLQGNIAQGDKFDEAQFVNTLETNRRLAQHSEARLIVFPETALPLLRENLP
ncbi:MAG: apolipoprotein N-acyltransferase, partial [Gallionellaceae bacterium]|nr:apolipoprotein N-acyltransferase [Gallionellaceae bacterium]